MSGSLTTHVLDTSRGRPAANVAIEVWATDPQGDNRRLLKTARTNSDGRTDAPLLAGAELQAGYYELVFTMGDYFAAQSSATSEPPFLNRIPVRFAVADPAAHYHVPLLASPWAYITYRGS
ncbi:MAG: hydroxyisourate hydrolase [Acidobacteria bacterium]|nr:MAG: hydroxyisourate hydrolase [Acidobacteriota bacterium]PYV32945.1 MAG: hydroxyisourate hydrolase [Acidobacteriota bacterium]